MEQFIKVRGAKENNLKNIDVTIPRDKLVVFTGVSGSGKSTLAFNTIFAEGQRRYIESLSSYARQFLGQSQKPDVESIEGLSPSISIDQKTTNHNPRSTVGTVTEIYDYIRLLYARVGKPYCPNCNLPIEKQSIDQIVEKILAYPKDSKILVLSPVIRAQKGKHEKAIDGFKKNGYVRIEIDGYVHTLDEEFNLDKNLKHDISVIVDRLVIEDGIEGRLFESVENAIKLSEGLVTISCEENKEMFSTLFSCPNCSHTLEEISPRLFSFNSPFGSCEHCTGLGYLVDVDKNIVLKNSNLSLNDGALNFTGWVSDGTSMASLYYEALNKKYGISLSTPLNKLPKEHLDILLYGNNGEKIEIPMHSGKFVGSYKASFEGIIPCLRRRYKETTSEFVKYELGKFFCEVPCTMCGGKRLNKSALSVKIEGLNIFELCNFSVEALQLTFTETMNSKNNGKTEMVSEHNEKSITLPKKINFTSVEMKIAESILKEISARLSFLVDVGLGYLTLSRSAESLSGGESQRIRLATQIGSGLVGVLYILDEPSIGLHQRDNQKLLGTLFKLRDLGNTLIVVEHDTETIMSADYIVDVGPLAGIHGGQIVAEGTPTQIMQNKNSITGKFLSGKEKIDLPIKRRKSVKGKIVICGACENNLKDITVEIPKGVFTVVTGVSGSGKSSLINKILLPNLSMHLNGSKSQQGNFKSIENIDDLDKVIAIDQSPIGRTPRSNPATYTGLFTPLRELFASTKDARERGYTAGRFSFNVRGGRCEACDGAGVKKIEMYFLPDITVPCEVCKGKRYNRETLEVKFKNMNISDVLNLTIEEATPLFEGFPSIYPKLKSLNEVGLGYVKLGQPATELSGGEAQRVKLATELCKRSTGKTVYILDEPTTGLHMYDVKKLINILQQLVESGNTVIVIEHNLDVIKCADYIVDLGPEGGNKGGYVICSGTPEQVAKCKNSYTGQFLDKMFFQNSEKINIKKLTSKKQSDKIT
ncbi:MAG: excinuclease ABC subunit UvrA [Clostridia bacterium]